jgi:hypothetical protein
VYYYKFQLRNELQTCTKFVYFHAHDINMVHTIIEGF